MNRSLQALSVQLLGFKLNWISRRLAFGQYRDKTSKRRSDLSVLWQTSGGIADLRPQRLHERANCLRSQADRSSRQFSLGLPSGPIDRKGDRRRWLLRLLRDLERRCVSFDGDAPHPTIVVSGRARRRRDSKTKLGRQPADPDRESSRDG